MMVILSSGLGRLHFAQSAEWLSKENVRIILICGWVPANPRGFFVRFCSKIVRRNLLPGMLKRVITFGDNGAIVPISWVDFLANGMHIVDRRLFAGRHRSWIDKVAWILFGWRSKSIIRKLNIHSDSVVFHIRSGAGHGGAIKLARKLGIPVLVDHSIAHPAYLEKHLRPEYEKNKSIFNIGISTPFWRVVAEDCDFADYLLVNSYFVRDTFVEQGYPIEKIKVVYLGVRSDFFGLRKVKANNRGDRKIKLLFTGGFGFRKGAEYILEAIRIVLSKNSVLFEMDVVGDCSNAKGLIDRYKDLPIRYHGHVPQDELKSFLMQSDIYVFPSLAEGCASSGMEAMAAGLCVVATYESGLPIEDGVNGCIVPKKNAEELASTIMNLIQSPTKIDRIGAAAAALISSKYTWKKYAENVKTIYKEICQ